MWSKDGCYVTGLTSDRVKGLKIKKNQIYEYILTLPNIPFTEGTYISNLSIHDGLEFLSRQENLDLSVVSPDREEWGVVNVKHYWSKF